MSINSRERDKRDHEYEVQPWGELVIMRGRESKLAVPLLAAD
jgi:hypothetical protein